MQKKFISIRMHQKIKMTYQVLLFAILLSVCDIATSQTKNIKGVINDYAEVTAISSDRLTVTLSEASMFIPNHLPDTVLLIQMTGITVPDRVNAIWNNAGNYEFHIVESVSGQSITLQWPVTSGTFSPNTELVQMVRVPSYKNAQIDDVLTCKPWNWEDGTGGVLAFFVNGSLTFNANIDVSGKGYMGGKVSGDAYTGDCIQPDNNDYDVVESSVTAGYKGEGAITKQTIDGTPKGWGRTWNGGGGGNGKWSGGGGGANFGKGGPGDVQVCYPTPGFGNDPLSFGNDGFNIKYLDESNVFWSKRAFMGGGGGAGTGEDATRGGNGGGIVMIVANDLHFSSNTTIRANGESVAGTAMYGGGGGGGAGGSILLTVEDYGDIKAEVNGGNGGNVYVKNCNEEVYSKGTGGGGGGGLIFAKGNTSPINEHYEIKSGQMGGPNPTSGCLSWWGGVGSEGQLLGDFQVQLKGFLNNYIFDSDTVYVCRNEKGTIRASAPIGVTAPYNFAWQYSTDEGNTWRNPDLTNSTVTGDSTQFNDGEFRFSQSGALKMRRVVKSATGTTEEIIDKSEPVTVFVRPPVDNSIMPPDTVCWTKSFMITGNDLSKNYLWEEESNGNWKNPAGMNTGSNLTIEWASGDVKQTYRYRRIASSSFGCKDTSVTFIHVLPAIKNNTITSGDQEVCKDNIKTLQSLTGPNLSGGDFSNYYCQWQFMTDSKDWSNIPGVPDNMTDCDTSIIRKLQNDDEYYYYRRIVTSGVLVSSGNEICIDTSPPVKIVINKIPSPPLITTPETDLTGDNVLAFRFKKELAANQPTTGNGMWSSPDDRLIFEPPDQPETTVSNLQKGVNTVYWTVGNGACPPSSASRTIEVIVPSTIGFSPNGDKKNDCFMIPAVKDADISELIIFDRYNKVVFKQSFKGKSNLDCLWDGNNLPSGTYFYQLTLDGNKIYKGYVVLKKQ